MTSPDRSDNPAPKRNMFATTSKVENMFDVATTQEHSDLANSSSIRKSHAVVPSLNLNKLQQPAQLTSRIDSGKQPAATQKHKYLLKSFKSKMSSIIKKGK